MVGREGERISWSNRRPERQAEIDPATRSTGRQADIGAEIRSSLHFPPAEDVDDTAAVPTLVGGLTIRIGRAHIGIAQDRSHEADAGFPAVLGAETIIIVVAELA